MTMQCFLHVSSSRPVQDYKDPDPHKIVEFQTSGPAQSCRVPEFQTRAKLKSCGVPDQCKVVEFQSSTPMQGCRVPEIQGRAKLQSCGVVGFQTRPRVLERQLRLLDPCFKMGGVNPCFHQLSPRQSVGPGTCTCVRLHEQCFKMGGVELFSHHLQLKGPNGCAHTQTSQRCIQIRIPTISELVGA